MRATLFLYTFIAALGGLLFGFDTAVISGTIPFITDYFQLSEAMLGWSVSSALVGCIFGALLVGKPGDMFGRRAVLMVMGLLFLISAIGTGLANDLTIFIAFRFIGGIAVGGASVMSPMYISEIAPAKSRGRLVAVSQLAIVTGILVAFFSNFLLEDTGENNWRYMFMAEGIPAIFFVIFLFFIVKSPRWLVKKGREEEARAAIAKVNPDEDPDLVIRMIHDSLYQEETQKEVNIFKAPYSRLIMIGVAVGMFNQLTGINVIMYYAPTIFTSAGFSSEVALLQTVGIGITNLTFTILAMTLIDRFGRKFLLYIGAVGMSIFLGLFAYAYWQESFADYSLLIYLVGYIAFFAFSQGAVIWVLLSEMFPNNIRARGTAIGSFSHWFFNFLISSLFPIASANFGTETVFAFFCISTVLSMYFYYHFLVETKGRSLEEIEQLVLK